MSFSLRTSVAKRLATAVAVGACLLGLAAVRPQPAAAGPQQLNLRVSVALVPSSGAMLKYRGTFTGAPLGRGKVSLSTKLGGGGDATVSYVLTNSRGSIGGSAHVTLIYKGTSIDYRGAASITKGTGSYRRVRSRTLRVFGRAGLTAEHVTLSLAGPITS